MSDLQELLIHRGWQVETCPVDLGYHLVPQWAKVPADWTLGAVVGDEGNRLFLFGRGDHVPEMIYFRVDGALPVTWSEPKLGRPHMITIDKYNAAWLIDGGGHVIGKAGPDGNALWDLGEPHGGMAPGPGLEQCTDLGFRSDGCRDVSDGNGAKGAPKGSSPTAGGSQIGERLAATRGSVRLLARSRLVQAATPMWPTERRTTTAWPLSGASSRAWTWRCSGSQIRQKTGTIQRRALCWGLLSPREIARHGQKDAYNTVT